MQLKQITSEPIPYVFTKRHESGETFPKSGQEKRRDKRKKQRKMK